MRQFAWAVAVAVCGRGRPGSAGSAKPSGFHSGVDLVRFDLSVIDADGNPLTDIRPDEIADPRRRQAAAARPVPARSGAERASIPTSRCAPSRPRSPTTMRRREVTSTSSSSTSSTLRPATSSTPVKPPRNFIRTRVRGSDRIAVFGDSWPRARSSVHQRHAARHYSAQSGARQTRTHGAHRPRAHVAAGGLPGRLWGRIRARTR